MKFYFKKSFTMAEVLITLGILGVVIAMTLPSLIHKYQVHVVETRLKKFYSIMNQSVLLAKNEHGDVEGWSYFVEEEQDEDGNNINKNEETDTAFDTYLAPYLNIIERKELIDDGDNVILYKLADGSAFRYPYFQNREIIFFPANAEKCIELTKAESFGICAFPFEFYPISKDKSWKYLYQKGVEPYLFAWDGKKESLYSGSTYSCVGSSYPYYCTAIIARNGLKVPDDYPKKIRW